VLALSGALAVLGAACVLVGAAVVTRHRATAAADLAALAAAGRAVTGDPAPCAAAADVARADGAFLTGCSVLDDGTVAVRVRVVARLGPAGPVAAEARARAGPVPP
jgi:secretion/DNA translocation related TadE-like protein